MDHDIELILQIWKALRTHVLAGDRSDAAEDFIHTLLEHGIDPNEIIEFGVDADLKLVLRDHADEEHFDDEDEDDFDNDENVGWGN